ncbi:hypothetical protein Nepgr_005391 [Nepenthes gracilis]|uniref:Transmembrane protein n=1 Tax=Nepenthes gracilis TaxID=150966 RepID=A0AAD3XGD7_NEPGR|nr:hypothetical protein Nepgr_005391 [Nepenthes gracilis]
MALVTGHAVGMGPSATAPYLCCSFCIAAVAVAYPMLSWLWRMSARLEASIGICCILFECSVSILRGPGICFRIWPPGWSDVSQQHPLLIRVSSHVASFLVGWCGRSWAHWFSFSFLGLGGRFTANVLSLAFLLLKAMLPGAVSMLVRFFEETAGLLVLSYWCCWRWQLEFSDSLVADAVYGPSDVGA